MAAALSQTHLVDRLLDDERHAAVQQDMGQADAPAMAPAGMAPHGSG